MSDRPGPGEEAARARLAALFVAFDRLTPDELARVGFRMAPDEEREPLLAAVDEAATRTGRQALVDEARELARDAVMRRYAAGTYHPTWVGLNWGLSQGRVEDRVSIAETLADAAAAAVVEDVLDPVVVEALAADARDLLGLAAGTAYEGSLDRVLYRSGDPDLRTSPAAHRARVAVAVVLAALAASAGLAVAAAPAVVAAVLAGQRLRSARRRRG